ncbi:MAG TPA: response regulator [Vicinamibacterales bacterium]|nr:response regulator [Vicinamibacterales bacterium]
MSRRRDRTPYVLVVDDDQDALTIAQLTLDWAGIRVQVAASAAEGLRMVVEDPPAVALIDLEMPIMSGIAFLRALRADPMTQRVATVALTGVPEILDAVSDVKFDWVLTKPVAPDDLVRIVRSLIATSEVDPV